MMLILIGQQASCHLAIWIWCWFWLVNRHPVILQYGYDAESDRSTGILSCSMAMTPSLTGQQASCLAVWLWRRSSLTGQQASCLAVWIWSRFWFVNRLPVLQYGHKADSDLSTGILSCSMDMKPILICQQAYFHTAPVETKLCVALTVFRCKVGNWVFNAQSTISVISGRRCKALLCTAAHDRYTKMLLVTILLTFQ